MLRDWIYHGLWQRWTTTILLCSLDLVLYSPPYNIGIDASVYHDKLTEAEYVQQQTALLLFLATLIKPTGYIIVNLMNRQRDGQCITPNEWLSTLYAEKPYDARLDGPVRPPLPPFILRSMMTWNRGSTVNENPKTLKDPLEYVYILSLREYAGLEHYYEPKCIEDDEGKLTRKLTTYLYAPPEQVHDALYAAPALAFAGLEKPPPVQALALAKALVQTYCREGGMVLDPFMGTGTTAIACMLTGRHFVGCEQNLGTALVANQRLRDEVKTLRRPCWIRGADGEPLSDDGVYGWVRSRMEANHRAGADRLVDQVRESMEDAKRRHADYYRHLLAGAGGEASKRVRSRPKSKKGGAENGSGKKAGVAAIEPPRSRPATRSSGARLPSRVKREEPRAAWPTPPRPLQVIDLTSIDD